MRGRCSSYRTSRICSPVHCNLVFARHLGHFYHLLHQILLNLVVGESLEDGLLHYLWHVNELLILGTSTNCSCLCDTGTLRICSLALYTRGFTASTTPSKMRAPGTATFCSATCTRFFGAKLASSASSNRTGDPALPRSRGIHDA